MGVEELATEERRVVTTTGFTESLNNVELITDDEERRDEVVSPSTGCTSVLDTTACAVVVDDVRRDDGAESPLALS